MPCTRPKLAVQLTPGRQLSFLKRRSQIEELGGLKEVAALYKAHRAYNVPCGQCLQCRIKAARLTGARCQHELQMHERGGVFLTLTYSPEHLPADRSVNKEIVPKLIADLRSATGLRSSEDDRGISYYQAGEYGSKLFRPHYHLLLFGFQPPRDQQVRFGKNPLFTSRLIEELWPYGHAPFGALTFASACYTARYSAKKILGKKAQKHYQRIDPETGEVFQLQPEFSTQSTRGGGLGRDWLLHNWRDVYPRDLILINGRPHQPPRYYDRLMEDIDPTLIAEVKEKRLTKIHAEFDDDRLADLERATYKQFENLMRTYE